MLDSFKTTGTGEKYVPEDKKQTRLHAGHPVAGKHAGRSEEQVEKENATFECRPLLNKKTGGRK